MRRRRRSSAQYADRGEQSGEVLKSDASTKRKEAEMMADQLESKTRERSMMNQIAAKEEEIARFASCSASDRSGGAESSAKQAQFEHAQIK